MQDKGGSNVRLNHRLIENFSPTSNLLKLIVDVKKSQFLFATSFLMLGTRRAIHVLKYVHARFAA